MKRPTAIAALALAAITFAGCQSAAPPTPSPTAPGSPTAAPSQTDSAPPSASPTAVTPTTAPPSPTGTAPSALEDMSGTWLLEVSNPRVLFAAGNASGGSVAIDADRYVFTAGDYFVEGPVELVGTMEVDCSASSCRFVGGPPYVIWPLEDQLVIVEPVNLTSLGSFEGRCGWEDIPQGGLLSVEATEVVDGRERPSVVSFTSGTAGGVGAQCEQASFVIAWDVTATRLP